MIIPSYNRAHVIIKTIPSYMQEGVGEIIVIDDCSTDHTQETLLKLKNEIPCLVIKRNKRNRKQTYSKNRGIRLARYPYIYFGDDDSFLTQGTIPVLLGYIKEHPNALISARPLYLKSEREMKDLKQYIRSTERHSAEEGYRFLDWETMTVDWDVFYPKLKKVDVTPACFLIATEHARKLSFDPTYQAANAFREETDFIMQATEMGLDRYFAPHAYQINYPRAVSDKKTKKRAGFAYRWGHFKNTKYFFDKHYQFMKSSNMVHSSKYRILLRYLYSEMRQIR
ncbi:MAG: glycosyltransferase [bacterium]|nr:glycosyltransferase [bacterium]